MRSMTSTAVTVFVQAKSRPVLVWRMRILLAAAALAVIACSSSGPATPKQKANIPPPDFEILQLVGPAQLNYEEGPFEVKYRLEIGDRADVPMTLSRLEIMTVNPEGGAYTLDASHRAYYFNKTVNPHEQTAVDFWAKAYGYGRNTRDN